jgi:hypothetical protein
MAAAFSGERFHSADVGLDAHSFRQFDDLREVLPQIERPREPHAWPQSRRRRDTR